MLGWLDRIHPVWFLVVGLVGVSTALVLRDWAHALDGTAGGIAMIGVGLLGGLGFGCLLRLLISPFLKT